MTQPRTGHSLLRRIVAIVVAAQLCSALLLSGASLLHERNTRLRALDTSLQGRSDSLLGAIQDAEDPGDNVTVDPEELHLPPEDVYAVYNQGGRLLGTSPRACPGLTARHGDGFRQGHAGHTSYRILEREALRVIDRAENGGIGLRRPVTIVYAMPERHLWHEIFEAARFYLALILLLTSVTVLLLVLLLRASLRPLADLATAAAALAPPALRFDPPPSVRQVRELQPLAAALTTSVTRLRDAFAREQRFVGDAAHELKTAIAVVRSSIQLLMLRRRSPDEYTAGLERILDDNRRVESLVAQMLELAAADATPGSPMPALDLHQLTAAALDRLRPYADHREIPLHLTPATAPTPVRLLPEQASTLISNLVLNAVQHSQPGQPVTVTVARPTPGEITLQVADTGAGIAPEALPHIFERFFREDRSRSRETGGTGLGLSICKALVEAAGGTIQAESTPTHGTRLTITLPTA